MRPPAPLVAAAIPAAMLALGAGTAAAADESKPASREVAKLSAPDADVSAAAARIDEQGSALGSYWDPDKAELVVVVGPDSDIGEPEAEKLVGGSYRLERLTIARKTVDGIREEIAGREFAPEAPKYSYASYLDLHSGRVVLQTDAPAEVTERLLEEH